MSQELNLDAKVPSKVTNSEELEKAAESPGFLGSLLRIVTLGMWS
jgi:hypothetical protein